MFKDYIVQNWSLILLLVALAIMLGTTIFLDRKVIRRMSILLVLVFLLSIIVFVEFYYDGADKYPNLRIVLMSIRYSATPLLIAYIIYTLIKKLSCLIFIPALVLTIIDIVSIFTGIVFALDENGDLKRGFLGYLPFIVAGLYCFALIYLLVKRSNKQATEIIPIVFLAFSFISGLVLPFILGKEFSHIFCVTVTIALFVYYVFSILQLTKMDPLTGLLNRQAYYSDVNKDIQDITALVSLDMNGLKKINDTYGHAAGDEALTTLALCFNKAVKRNQAAYRVGGDEFVIVCRKNSEDEVLKLIERINKYVSETDYSCSIGYSLHDSKKSIDVVLKESDDRMYLNKEKYYNSDDESKE